MCLRQVDIKAFIAYSSIGHIALVIIGILNDQVWGILSSIITIYAHGLCSSAIFCIAYYSYLKVRRRRLIHTKGLLQVYPILSFFSLSILFIFVIGLMIFFRGVYNIFLYTSINHGVHSKYILYSVSINSSQYVSLIIHIFPIILFLKLELFFFRKKLSLNYKINALVLSYSEMNLISRFLHIKIIILHQQNVSIKQQLKTQYDDFY
uniref:NADH-ubiquinone oxidoreductase chain 4 n=1 Tax=Biomphalaria glabrata TaxID=6526 RepID=A0A2C9K485_BIOGL